MNHEAIKQAMLDEIADPKPVYMPNSPAAFVRDRLFTGMHWAEAAYFWQHACSRKMPTPELQETFDKLEQLSKHEIMPAWGTYGS